MIIRWIIALSLLCGAAFAQSGVGLPPQDQYGGIIGKPCATAAPAINHVYKSLSPDGRWHLCTAVSTPGTAGNELFLIAGANVQANISCTADSGSTYPQRIAQKFNNTTISCGSPNSALYCLWGGVITRRLKNWGFNSTSFGSVSYTDGWDRVTACNGIVPIAAGFNGSTGAAWASGINPYRILATGQYNPAVSAVKNSQSYIPDGSVKDIYYAQNTTNSGLAASSTQLPDMMDPRLGQAVAGELANDGINGPGAHLKQCIADSPWCPYINIDQHDNIKTSGPPYLNTGLFPSQPTSKQDIHSGWAVLISAPFISTNGNKKVSSNVQIYPDDINYTKQGLVNFMIARYGNITALNADWGTSYTGFVSARVHVAGEVVATGDGVTNSFTFTLAHANLDPFSLLIKVAGVAQGGGCPKTTTGCSTAPTGGANMIGTCTSTAGDPCGQTNPITGGTVIHSTGVVTTMTFTTPPANGASITADYDHDGFTYATTLADEDGGKGAKAGCTDFTELNGCNANMKAALEDFMWSPSDGPSGTNGTKTMWGFYFRQIRDAIKNADPNMLYAGSYYQCGQWRTPCHPKVLQAAGAFVDLFQDTMDFTSASSAARMASLTSNLGDIPIVDAQYITFISDSRLSGGTDPQAGSPASLTSAGAAGAFYASELLACWNLVNAQGHNPCIGYSYWNGMSEQKSTVQPGLVSSADNPYDGNPRNTGPYTDDYGYNNNITAGATESKIYGDFLNPAIQANQRVMWLLKAAK